MRSTKVAIVGAGYAGLAAAVELARHDHEVTVFEASDVLGGRARTLGQYPLPLSNGRHMLRGSYTETLRLLRFLGVPPRRLRNLPFSIFVPERLQLEVGTSPPFLALPWAALRSRGLCYRDRIALLRMYRRIVSGRSFESGSVAELLEETGQTPLLREVLWAPHCLATLAALPQNASAWLFVAGLQSLFASSSSSLGLLPHVDMSELFAVPATLFLSQHGHSVRTLVKVRTVHLDHGRFLLDGDSSEGSHYSHVIIATAAREAADLLADFDELALLREQLRGLKTEPVTTVYLGYRSPIALPAPVIQCPASMVQQIVDCGVASDGLARIAGIVRGHNGYASGSDETLLLETHRLVEELVPQAGRPAWNHVVREGRAVYAGTVGLVRPRTMTGVSNLFLAGDYVESPCPPNLESAVRSGLAAARQVLKYATN